MPSTDWSGESVNRVSDHTRSGEEIEVAPVITAKWAKAVFLVLLGIVLLFYSDGFVKDLETNTADEWNMSFEWTWDLLRWLIWILIAWLFVDAALTITLSFSMDKHTLSDVMERLDKIEEKISVKKVRTPAIEPVVNSSPLVVEDEEEPPPPTE